MSELYELHHRVWATMKFDRADPASRREHLLWTQSLPFYPIANGDALAFDLTGRDEDPPILYLCHDEPASGMIAPNFDAFLTAWEQLFYVGPEWWMLDPFLVGKGRAKRLSPRGEGAKKLRDLFDLRDRPARKPYNSKRQFIGEQHASSAT